MLHGHSYMVLPRHGILSGAAVATDQLLLHIPQLLVREEEPCQLELEGNGHCRSARYLNLWLARLLFSYEQLADGQQNLVCRDCLNTFDATSGYCVTVTVQHRPFPGHFVQGDMLPVQCAAVWPGTGVPHLHRGHQAHCTAAVRRWGPAHFPPRRPVPGPPVFGPRAFPHVECGQAVWGTGLAPGQRQVPHVAHPGGSAPGARSLNTQALQS